MKLYMHALVIITSLAILRSQNVNKDPYAVTKSFEGLEEMYLRLRDREPNDDSLLTAKQKWQICKRIFIKGEYLRASKQKVEILLNPDRDETWLKTNRKDIYNDLFEKSRTSSSLFSRQEFCYVNRSRLRPINVRGENHPENVFECQAYDRQEIYVQTAHYDLDRARDSPYNSPRQELQIRDDVQHVRRYFVSDNEYNVNDVPKGVRVGGRFVFYYNVDTDQIVLHALAEESTPEIRKDKKAHYLKRRNGHPTAANERDDPICGLDPGRRLRLCNSVLIKLTRAFGTEAIEDGCERRFFTLKNDPEEIQYSEWMLKCTCRFPGTMPYAYVSRGYQDNEVFIHSVRGIEATMKLSGYKKNVAVVRDNTKKTTKSGPSSSTSAPAIEDSEENSPANENH